jgi:predicted N-formylglutamate amidohydrolase
LTTSDDDSPAASSRLLSSGDAFPAAVYNLSGRSPFVLLGDHSGRAIPRTLGDLGVSGAGMDRHIAWDIGVAGMGAVLGDLLDAAFIRQTYSRLVVDCNRAPGAEGLFVQSSDGTAVPGNTALAEEDKRARMDEVFWPYHARISAVLDARAAQGLHTILVSLHSFTPVMNGFARPWRFGVLHLHDSAFSLRMLAALRAGCSDPVGENEPYKMDGIDFTIPYHAKRHGLDYVEIEVRQDTIADAQGQRAAAQILCAALRAAEAQ